MTGDIRNNTMFKTGVCNSCNKKWTWEETVCYSCPKKCGNVDVDVKQHILNETLFNLAFCKHCEYRWKWEEPEAPRF